ncbi:MAG: nitroreductase family protein [Pseudohongiellaceae bacterium]|jgi:nitroreductase
MNAIEALHQRASMPRLDGPAPGQEALDNIFRAALRAADHGLLRPWRFLTIQGESLHRLGNLFAAVAEHDNPAMSPTELDKVRQKPLRAPLIVVVISSPREHPKVPVFEQDLSAAAAAQNMLVAAFAQGLGAMWRTGSMAYHPQVKQGLGLQTDEKIIGFLYLGEAAAPGKKVMSEDPANFVQEW